MERTDASVITDQNFFINLSERLITESTENTESKIVAQFFRVFRVFRGYKVDANTYVKDCNCCSGPLP